MKANSRSLVVLVLLLAWPTVASAQQPAFDVPDGAPAVAIMQAAAELSRVLAADGPHDTIRHDASTLTDGLYLVRASVPGSYPGTGVAAMLVDRDGARYGEHGDRNLADLFRSRGWIEAPPADGALLVRLVDAAYFEGMGSCSPSEPGVVVEEGALRVHFSQFTPPGPAFPWQVVIPAEGPARLYTVDNTGGGDGSGLLQVR